jgi:hypothetical protein
MKWVKLRDKLPFEFARTGFVFIYALMKSRETFLNWRRYGHMVTPQKRHKPIEEGRAASKGPH